jgi:hypothetical protein
LSRGAGNNLKKAFLRQKGKRVLRKRCLPLNGALPLADWPAWLLQQLSKDKIPLCAVFLQFSIAPIPPQPDHDINPEQNCYHYGAYRKSPANPCDGISILGILDK